VATANLKALTSKLNSVCRKALEHGLGLCVSRTNYNVEVEHWLAKLLEPSDSDVAKILKQYDIRPGQVNRELTRSLDALKTGNARQPTLSQEITDLMSEAWTLTSLEYNSYRIRSGYLLAAMLTERGASARIRQSCPELAKIPTQKLLQEMKAVIAGSVEDAAEPGEAAPAEAAAGPGAPPAGSKTPSLDQFTLNLTGRAKKGDIDPVIGRDFEIRQVIDILTRRRQNNPILVGEAGVGKTAVVEGFALRVVAGDVPDPLKGVAIRTLDLGLLQAGAGVKGEFENRLKSVIQEVQASPTPIILFIDEAHTLIGAGGAAGSGDAANLLKPALARGELRTVAATTFAEYKKSFEDDPALKRRFQAVKVDEPDRPRAVAMMRGIADVMEKHHKVGILDEALEESVRLSARYIPDRQLPDKSVSLLDTACARVALSQSTTPPTLEDTRREIEMLNVRIGIMERELQIGISHDLALAETKAQLEAATKRLAELEKRWAEEKKIVEKIQQLRTRLGFGTAAVAAKDGKEAKDGKDAKEVKETKETKDGKAAPLPPAEAAAARTELDKLTTELTALQGETPLVQPVVNGQAVAEVVAGWTGIPLGKMVRNEIQAVMTLAEKLKARVVGQDHAQDMISKRVQTSRAGLTDPRKPIGVFMFVGPSGVGKTETAIALADILYGGADRGLTVINMSEYKTDMMVSRLTGPAPGLVGYGKGGVLTEAVRRKPNSIVLLDEIEKSHESVQELFYQVFDKGTLQDEKGLEADFKNTIILLTSNTGTDTIMKVCADPDTMPDAEGLATALRPDLLKTFKPAFLGRITIIPYFPLSDEILKKIITLQLGRVRDRVRENHKASFNYDEALVNTIASRCKEVESGARVVDQIITGTLLPEMSREFLARMAEGQPITRAQVSVDGEGKFVYTIS
jgi:type VI secretion system protein VasG